MSGFSPSRYKGAVNMAPIFNLVSRGQEYSSIGTLVILLADFFLMAIPVFN
ncbi:hypothetical protein AF72_00225 [Xylella taiwanensis]|uniref:Uncharacterized protein n=1 Tax=Xylella taiwanensis TaxID=1444770 RepID=Z9JML9_9GAMM|nr:hypothetical protein [Xylella taiwanensis]EWS79429.1 hypothetical protein AF72_00225 [Xylella taiwanensis]UFN25929.1 hypothetical protein LPH62_05680 [Xylella taiwanensis]